MTGDSRELTRSHWYWRPGWRVGRRFFTWHVTFTDATADVLLPLMNHYRPVIETLTHLEPLPFEGLHLTTQGVGFTDEVDPADIDEIITNASERLKSSQPINAILGPAHIDAEGLFLTVRPDTAFQNLRRSLRAAITDTWGPDRVPENADSFTPHVTLAYSDGVVSLSGARDALDLVPPVTARLPVNEVTIIQLNRDNRRYEWSEISRVRLGPDLST